MFFCWILCIVFLGIFIYSISLFYQSKKCTCKTIGNIIDIKKKKHNCRNSCIVSYHAIYRYMVNGIIYEKPSAFDLDNPNQYSVGQEVLIYYEENNPDNFFVDYDIKLIPENIQLCAWIFVITFVLAICVTFFD